MTEPSNINKPLPGYGWFLTYFNWLIFRECPGARTRLVPWLNRELNALLYENTQLVMHLVDIIMDLLLRHHICSRTFRNLLFEYLDIKTDHFIHEFYSFMRSPFDMIGYDRYVSYSERSRSPPYVVTLPGKHKVLYLR